MAFDGGRAWPARLARRLTPAAPAPACGRRRLGLALLYAALALQLLGTLVFVGELWTEVLGLRTAPIPWVWQEYIQLLASVGLVTGVVVSVLFLRRVLRRMDRMSRQIDAAAGRFQGHLEQLFADWDLSPSERAVAVYAMKGFSNAEIAGLRGTSPSTIKSQMNAIYRKTGLGNRRELIAFLVEELLSGVAVDGAAQPEDAAAS